MNKYYILFMVASFSFVLIFQILAKLLVKNQKIKNILLKILAILMLGVHFSNAYVTFFKTGTAVVGDSLMFPIYPCNVLMWLTLILAFNTYYKDKYIYKRTAEFVFFMGIIGGIFGIVRNKYYGENPTLTDWNVLRSLLSHTFLLTSSIYFVVGDFIKIKVKSMLGVLFGFILLIIDGYTVIGIFRIFGKTPPNSMFLLEPPYPNIPSINIITMALAGFTATFIECVIFEFFTVEKGNRWYNKLALYIQKIKEKKIKN